ncbi:MAG TPA: rod shape-determining protein MreD [Candidatus Limnocylindrales bacterium]|nr:rod shape-determining protein MreD [Candidatus Limnocylindrales bacterium]
MRVAFAVVVPLAAALLQGSVVPFIGVGDARPNLVILAAASWALAAGAREAIWWAFLGGLAADLMSGGPVGAQALASLLPVAALGLTQTPGRARSIPTAALLIGAASFAAGILYILVLAFAGIRLPELPVLVTGTVLGAVYNAVLAIATYPLCRLVCRGADKQASFSGQAW